MEKNIQYITNTFDIHGKKPPTLKNIKITAKKDFIWLSCSLVGRNGGGSQDSMTTSKYAILNSDKSEEWYAQTVLPKYVIRK